MSKSRVRNESVVSLAYTLSDDQGRTLEERTPESPFEYLHGRNQIHRAVETALEGQTPGFSTTVRLQAEQAYGKYRPELVAEIPRTNFDSQLEIRPGMKFNTTGPDKQPLVVRVISVDEKKVTVDGNHPLAGVGLIFEARVLSVRDASEDELKTGMVVPSKRDGLH